MIYESILDTIGNTPVVKLHRIPPKHVTIYVKIEAFNPLSSVKDRLAFAIMTAAAWLGIIFLFLAVDPDVTTFPGVLFLVGFVLLGAMVMYGIYAIWRSGR